MHLPPLWEIHGEVQHGVKPCAFASSTNFKTYSSKIVIYPCSFSPKYQMQDTFKNNQYISRARDQFNLRFSGEELIPSLRDVLIVLSRGKKYISSLMMFLCRKNKNFACNLAEICILYILWCSSLILNNFNQLVSTRASFRNWWVDHMNH